MKGNKMPTYEYRCKKCGNDFEKVQRITEASLERCPLCRGVVERLISPSTFILKGGGWYASDNKTKEVSASNDDLA
jgi:putative FmdB family regulatory protein